MCTREVLGVENILLGTDYPYEDLEECVGFLDSLPVPPSEKEAICSGNARRLGLTI